MRVLWICLLLASGPALAVPVPFDSDRWKIEGEEVRLEEHLGQPALFLRNGRAVLTDVDLKQGAIEFDIAFTGERGFSGAMFHWKDAGNFEDFYLRPHQSGQPDASQYQPVFAGHSAWQIYYGERFAAPLVHRFDTWQHVRIEFLEDRAAVYVDSEEPVLIIGSLDRNDPGGAVGLKSGFAPAHFANFEVHESSDVEIDRPEVPARDGADREVRFWKVSSAFDEDLVDIDSLEAFPGAELTWSKLEIESNGIANLGRTAESRRPNTKFASIIVNSGGVTRRAFEFGYSDRARVFVNGRLVYAGTRKYRSQDHRYLGTIGLFDRVILDLRKGSNEIAIAVSEDFGGWGVAGRFVDASGLRWGPR